MKGKRRKGAAGAGVRLRSAGRSLFEKNTIFEPSSLGRGRRLSPSLGGSLFEKNMISGPSSLGRGRRRSTARGDGSASCN